MDGAVDVDGICTWVGFVLESYLFVLSSGVGKSRNYQRLEESLGEGVRVQLFITAEQISSSKVFETDG